MSSRWNKSRPQSYTLPLDALLKENENTNRPVHAARSAGTVGKWGTTSFTSIRARPIYGFASFSPNQDASFQYPSISPDAAIEQAADATVVPKPKKFFKSRNSVPDTDLAGAVALAETPVAVTALPMNASAATRANVQQPQPTTSKIKIKINKKNANGTTRKTKTEKVVTKVEKVPKAEKQPILEKKAKVKKRTKADEKPIKVVPEVKPTRVLSRTRKTVNYMEDRSRSPSPKRQAIPAPEQFPQPPLPPAQCDLETSPIHQPQFNSDGEPLAPIETQAIDHLKAAASPPSTSKILPSEHPPIVLRISKGTSRLVSTDSEGLNNSPPYLSPIQQHQHHQLSHVSYTSAAASLVAVLSDEPLPQIPNQNEIAETAVDLELPIPVKPKPKSRKTKAVTNKLKIKANAKLKNNNDNVNDQEVVKQTNTRSSRQQKATAVAAASAIEETNTSIPEIGTANYELYRTLTAEEKDFDAQNDTSLVSPVAEQTDLPQQSTEVDAHLVSPHSETPQNADNTPVNSSAEPKKRGARGKAKTVNNIPIEVPTTVLTAVKEEPIPKRIRGRRNQVVEPIPVVEESGRRRITAAAKKHYIESEETPALPVIAEEPPEQQPIENLVPVIEVVPEVTQQKTRGRKKKKAIEAPVEVVVPSTKTRSARATRHNTNGNMMQENETKMVIPTVTRSYGRKRKQPDSESTPVSTENLTADVSATATNTVADDISLLLPDIESTRQNINLKMPFAEDETTATAISTDARIPRIKLRRPNQNGLNSSVEQTTSPSNNNEKLDNSPFSNDMASDDFAVNATQPEVEKPSVKLVISKKKGSIFKSRAIDSDSGDSGKKQKRHVYKHKWDDDEEKTGTAATKTVPADNDDPYADDIDMEAPIAAQIGPNAGGTSKLSRQTRANVPDDDLRIRNVKKAHQMQEIGEFQEMDDDVEYILESLKSQNPIATRSLAAIQLASKCMTPAFRMHVRAHGTATKFFGALHDATQNQSLGLCTATIMFVLIQDNLNMDLDKHSLELMLNLLDSDISQKNNYKDSGLTDEQSQRNEQKVFEICREIKSQGKAVHLNLDNISIGTLAMETLLTLTSKRAGDWFKDELRQLGGLEHIINTICECCKQISDCVVEWTEPLLEKLRKIERCLRVLENVSERNEDNQKYILTYKSGHAIETLVNFYKLCDSEIVLYPTKDATTATNYPGVVLREALVPTLKVLINLTHTFHSKPLGSVLFGEKTVIFDTSLHLLLQAPNYVPEKCIFELSLLVLLLLINLTVHSVPNRTTIMEASAPTDSGNKFVNVPAIKALIEYFYKYEEMARFVEQNTDAILENPEKSEKAKHKSQEEIEETVSTLLQRAGNHMEHTMLASYVCLLVGHLVMDYKENETNIRKYLRNGTFEHMVQILEKYYNFMNLTASSEAIQVAHMKETKRIIQFMKNSDVHSTTDAEQPVPEQTYSTKSKVGTNSKTLDTTTATSRLNSTNTATASSSGSSTNSMFNRVYFSGR